MKELEIVIIALLLLIISILFSMKISKGNEKFSGGGFSVTSGLSLYNRGNIYCDEGDEEISLYGEPTGRRSSFCTTAGTVMF